MIRQLHNQSIYNPKYLILISTIRNIEISTKFKTIMILKVLYWEVVTILKILFWILSISANIATMVMFADYVIHSIN